jgi:hypothetical protein
LDTAGCDDNRCIVVGVPNEATPTTFKCRLTAAVSFVDQPALMAGLAAVGRVDRDERHPAGLSLIAQERAELSERPRVQRGPLGLAKPYPRPDPRQLFDGDTAPGALRLGHDGFGDLMIDVGREAGLFTRVENSLTSGLTSRDIAAAGFISPKTVEANLARIYSNWASLLEPNSAESSLSKSTTNGTIAHRLRGVTALSTAFCIAMGN